MQDPLNSFAATKGVKYYTESGWGQLTGWWSTLLNIFAMKML